MENLEEKVNKIKAAIEHCKDVANSTNCSKECAIDHLELAGWLEELLRCKTGMKWHFTKQGDYPKPREGRGENDEFQCLVYHKGMYRMLYWNCYYECWDDEQGDDHECDKERVEKWCYLHEITSTLDSLTQEKEK